jgi:hypothetical protein
MRADVGDEDQLRISGAERDDQTELAALDVGLQLAHGGLGDRAVEPADGQHLPAGGVDEHGGRR